MSNVKLDIMQGLLVTAIQLNLAEDEIMDIGHLQILVAIVLVHVLMDFLSTLVQAVLLALLEDIHHLQQLHNL